MSLRKMLLVVLLVLAGAGGVNAALNDLQNGVIYDDASDLYWFQDLTLFNNQRYSGQMGTISTLNANNSFSNSLWGDWHMADTDEMQSLWNNGSSLTQSFLPAYSIYYYGRYNEEVDTPQFSYGMHQQAGYMAYSSGTIRNQRIPGDWPTSDNYNASGLSAWVVADSVFIPDMPDGAVKLEVPDFEIPDFESGKIEEWGILEKFNGFDSEKKTVVIVHGWNRESDRTALPNWVEEMAAPLMEKGVNVVAWNWQEVAYDELPFPNDAQDFIPGEAINLSRELAAYFNKDCDGDTLYSGDIQLIGHSLGSGIVARTTIYMQDKFSIERLTILDGPVGVEDKFDSSVYLDRLLGQVGPGTYIENYASWAGEYYSGKDTLFNYGLLPEFKIGETSWSDHTWSHEWYKQSIGSGMIEGGYDGQPMSSTERFWAQDGEFSFREDGYWTLTPFPQYHETHFPVIPLKSGDFGTETIFVQDDLDFYAEGSVWEHDNMYTLLTNSPVYLMANFWIPEDANLSFELSMFDLHEGDKFELWMDNFLLCSVYADVFDIDEWFTISDIDLSRFAGKMRTLTFGLIAEMDGVHSSMGIRNIEIYSYESSQASVPEPGTFALLGLGLLGVTGIARRKRR